MVDTVEILVEEISTSVGTGDFTLTGKNARRTFNESYGTGGIDKFFYFIIDEAGDDFEHGTGHLSGAATLVRDTVIKSSNGDALVIFGAGTKDVVSDRPGNLPNQVGDISFNAQIFTSPGDYTEGTTLTLTLTETPIGEGNVLILFNAGAQQTTEYNLVGNLITFTDPIPVGVTQVEARVLTGGGIFTQNNIFTAGITAFGPLNLAHTFGEIPTQFRVSLINLVAEHNYTVGQKPPIAFMAQLVNQGISIIPSTTNLLCRFGSAVNTFSVNDATTGVSQNITNTSWDIEIDIWQ